MIRRPPRSTPYPTLFPYTTLFRSCKAPIKEITNGLCTVSRDYSISNSCSYRSEEHTSELQPHSEISYAVFCLKKKNPGPATRRGGGGVVRGRSTRDTRCPHALPGKCFFF